MPDRFHAINVTCPANTPANAPVEIPFTEIAPGIVRRFTIVIPDGHAGLTGISLGFAHTPLIPDAPGSFYSGNDETIPPIDITGFVNGVTWAAFVCNSDIISHSWQVRVEVDEFRVGQPVTPTTAIPVQDIIKAGEDLALRTQQAAAPAEVPPSETSPDETVTADVATSSEP